MSHRPVSVLLVACSFLCLPARPLAAASPKDVVVTWKGGSISRADYDSWRQFHRLDDSPEARREMAYVESFAALSRKKGDDQDLRMHLELEAVRHQLLLPVLHQYVTAQVQVTDAEVEKWAHQYPNAFHRPRKLHLLNIYKHIEGKDRAAVRQQMGTLRRQLLQASPTESAKPFAAPGQRNKRVSPHPVSESQRSSLFQQLAYKESESQSRLRNGDLGFLDPEKLAPEVATAVRGLQLGELSPLVEQADGVSLFFCWQVRAAHTPTPEEVRSKLRANLLRQHRRTRWAAYEKDLLEKSGLQLHPDAKQDVLTMQGYSLSAAGLAQLVSLRLRNRKLSDLDSPQKERLLKEWAIAELIARQASALGLDHDPKITNALRWKHLDLLAQRELVRRVDARLHDPSEEAMHRRFAAQPQRYRQPESYDLSVIYFGPRPGESQEQRVEKAVKVAREIADHRLTFAAAARQYSSLPSATDGGRIGWHSFREIAGKWGPTVHKAILAMKPGDQSGLLRLESGLWIFALHGHRQARPMTFDEAKEELRNELRKEEIERLQTEVRTQQLKTIGVELQLRATAAPTAKKS